MKKVYLIVSSIVFGSLAFGQVNQTFMNEGKYGKPSINTEKVTKTTFTASTKAGGDIIYSQNFSGGTLGNMTTSGLDAAVWMNDLDGSNGQYAGTGTANTTAIDNLDAANGFAILDADKHTTDNPAHIDGYDAQLVSPTIDMTVRPGALLNFYCKYRYWGPYYQYPTVQVSTDNFITSFEFQIDKPGVRTNGTATTYEVSLNLSQYLATATNKSNFKFRISTNNLVLYYMEVDDIKLVETHPYDLKMSDMWLEDINFGYKEHTDIPTSIATGQMLTVQSHLVNKGHSIPTNTAIVVSVFNSTGTQVYTETGGNLSNNFTGIDDTITFITALDLGTLAVGTYKIKADVNISQVDADTDNDTLRRTMNRTAFDLGQRNYDLTRSTKSIGRYYGTDPSSDPMVVGNVMYIPNDITLHGLELTIGNGAYYSTTAGTEIIVKLYQMDYTTGGLDFTTQHVDMNDDKFFIITPAMIPTLNGYNNVVLNLHESTSNPGGMDLLGGNYYYVAISHPGGADTHLAYGANSRDDDYSSHYSGSDAAVFYSLGSQIHTRMNFDPQLLIDASVKTIENNDLSIGNLFPNPTNGKTTINYSLTNSTTVTVKVVDVTGKIVYSSNEGTQNNGSHKLNIDTSAFTNGVYYVTVSTDETQVTKKMIKN